MQWTLALTVLAGWLGSAAAADLTKVPRRIAKEPAYAAKAPRYCLLAFGPEAEARVWLVLDGDTLYIDRNGNGDLTEADEKVKLAEFTSIESGFLKGQRQQSVGTVSAWPKRTLLVTIMQMQLRPAATDVVPQEAEILKLLGDVPDGIVTGIIVTGAPKNAKEVEAFPSSGPSNAQVAMTDHQGALCFSAHAKDAPIVHFHGPLQMTLHPLQKFARNEQLELKAGIGTPGLGKGSFAMVLYQGRIPDDAHPVADVEFPSASPGKPAHRIKLTLDKRC